MVRPSLRTGYSTLLVAVVTVEKTVQVVPMVLNHRETVLVQKESAGRQRAFKPYLLFPLAFVFSEVKRRSTTLGNQLQCGKQ